MKREWKYRILLLLTLLPGFAAASLQAQTLPKLRPADERAILAVLSAQQTAWNQGDIETFMNGYWESDSLMFTGKTGIVYGYQNTLKRYRAGYPDRRAMGQLTFTILHVVAMSKTSAQVVGRWHLDREDGDLEGYFTLLWRKIDGEWVIVADHTS